MTPREAYYKCLNENKRISELEEIISTSIDYCYYYARDIIKGPWQQGEESINKDPEHSYFYARDIIKGPWERGEESISKDPKSSYWYARYIIEGPFEKCHHTIFNSKFKDDYIKFLKNINYDMTEIGEWLI